MDHPTRKQNRLKNYDYASVGSYFITVCTRNKEKQFGQILESEDGGLMRLSYYGQIARQRIQEIPRRYPSVRLDRFVVMPNHIHLLLTIADEGVVSIPRIINQMKGAVTKQIGVSIWQKLYHDRIVRNEAEYLRIWNYIDTNPQKWMLDCFYCA